MKEFIVGGIAMIALFTIVYVPVLLSIAAMILAVALVTTVAYTLGDMILSLFK